MSGKLYKLIRKYAKTRSLRYKACKNVFSKATQKEKQTYREEMNNVV